jgi:hypothetical protein
MGTWRLVLDEEAFHHLLAGPARDRRQLLSACEDLKRSPHRPPDYEITDATGRLLSVRAAPPFLLTYWLDSCVSEVRVVDIQRVRY